MRKRDGAQAHSHNGAFAPEVTGVLFPPSYLFSLAAGRPAEERGGASCGSGIFGRLHHHPSNSSLLLLLSLLKSLLGRAENARYTIIWPTHSLSTALKRIFLLAPHTYQLIFIFPTSPFSVLRFRFLFL